VQSTPDGYVTTWGRGATMSFMINGGFFALRREIFDYIEEGDELVEKPFERLREKQLLSTYRYTGFWQSMDTFKDRSPSTAMEARGECPWMIWKRPQG